MKEFVSFVLIISFPCAVLAQDFHKGGFFDSDVSQKGFFTDDQAGIPVKNNTGVITTRSKNDTWEVSGDKVAQMGTNDTATNNAQKDQTVSGDSFDVKKEPTD